MTFSHELDLSVGGLGSLGGLGGIASIRSSSSIGEDDCHLRNVRKPLPTDTLSTEDCYRADHMRFYGQYAHIRAKLDYSYHSNYSMRRQVLQDGIIDKLIRSTAAIPSHDIGSVAKPWIVFTAGAMGAGKSYTIRKLAEANRFPLHAFVAVDPDEVRRHLPEYKLYSVLYPDKAGELTNKECGYVAEMLTLIALEAGANVLVDGSLRDHKWYRGYFRKLRDENPRIRIAILHVTAPREAVLKRAQARSRATGRVVPMETLEKALEQVPRSVEILAPLADYHCELRNDPDSSDVEIVTKGQDWSSFKLQWFNNKHLIVSSG